MHTNNYINKIQELSLPNKYTNWYCQIVERAQSRATTKKQSKAITGKEIEIHHILPKSFNLGGEKDKLNYAFLTVQEHFLCHWMLSKMFQNKYKAKMIFALKGMNRQNTNQKRYNTKITSRVYARNKILANKQISELQTGRRQSNETKKKHSINTTGEKNPRFGKSPFEHFTEEEYNEHCQKQSENSMGSKNHFYNKHHSDKSKQLIIAARAAEIKTPCPYCNKVVDPANLSRWHGDNCKLNPHSQHSL